MNRQTIRPSMFVTAMLAASGAFAGVDIVKCVDQNGHVTLTDSQCSDGVRTVLVTNAGESPAVATAEEAPAAPAVRRVSVQRFVLPPAEMRATTSISPRPSSRMLARDVETMKAAKLSMQAQDEASATLKHQRLAGLN
jgi:hypothetical protein